MKLFNNPKNPNLNIVDGQLDGSYLHKDVVLDRVIHTLTPPPVWEDNAELLLAFSQTVVNYCPISINIMDYWNKAELYNILVPLDDGVFDFIPDDKVYQGPPKAFFINSMLNLQEKIAGVYMSNVYNTAHEARTSHTLRQNLFHTFELFGIPIDDKENLLFGDVNNLFTEEKFLTNKEFNMKKGKSISFKYITKNAYDAKIEGSLTAPSYFCEYEDIGIFNYKVTSSILPDVYNTFVKPLTHPLGMIGTYEKQCRSELSDRVLSDTRWNADAVTIRCSNTSDTSPLWPPTMLLPWVINDGSVYTDPVIPLFDDQLPAGPNNKRYIYDKSGIRGFDCVIPNTENITVNKNIQGPNDNQNALQNIVIASENGKDLWEMITDMDEGQGNILRDVQTGYGDFEYSGFTFTKYIFENGAYVIQYECMQEDGNIKRLIEYYRYDVYDVSIDLNLYANQTMLPREMYPTIETTNMINGVIYDALPFMPLGPIAPKVAFGYSDENQTEIENIGGLDVGVWEPRPIGYPTMYSSRVNLTFQPDYGETLELQTSTKVRPKNYFEVVVNPTGLFTTDFKITDSSGNLNIDVYYNGLLLSETDYHKVSDYSIQSDVALDSSAWLEIISRPYVIAIVDTKTAEQDQIEFYTTHKISKLDLDYPEDPEKAIILYDIFLNTGSGNVQQTVYVPADNSDPQNIIPSSGNYVLSWRNNTVSFPLDSADNVVINAGDTVTFREIDRNFISTEYVVDGTTVPTHLPEFDISYINTSANCAVYVNGIKIPSKYYDERVPHTITLIDDVVVDDVVVIHEFPTEMAETSHFTRDGTYTGLAFDHPTGEYNTVFAVGDHNDDLIVDIYVDSVLIDRADYYLNNKFSIQFSVLPPVDSTVEIVSEFDLWNYNLNHPANNVQSFLEGVKLKESEYVIIFEENEWTEPGVFEWEEDRNIINTKPRFVPVYALIGRWIETRGCIVNTFGLNQVDLPAIEEDFKVKIIPYQRNIINTVYENFTDLVTTNLVTTYSDKITQDEIDTNVFDKYEKK